MAGKIDVSEFFEIFLLMFLLNIEKKLDPKLSDAILWRLITQLIFFAFTCSKSTIETLEKGVKYVQSQWRRSRVFIVNFEHISLFRHIHLHINIFTCYLLVQQVLLLSQQF